jgi:hypothetical protein
LAWDPNSEPDLAGYKLYYKTESSGPPYDGTGAIEGDSPIDVENETEFTVTGLTNGETYFFVVSAYDTESLEGEYSNEVFGSSVIAEVGIPVPPTAPTRLRIIKVGKE